MKHKKKGWFSLSVLLILAFSPLGEAGNLQKKYINLSKEGNQATATDLGNIATLYGQVDTKLNTIIYDFSGKTAMGTVSGNAVKSEKGLTFDGINSYASIPMDNFPTSMNTIYVGFWASPAEARSTSILDALNPDDGNNRFNIHLPWSTNIIYWDFGNASSGGGRVYANFNPEWFNVMAYWEFTAQPGVGMKIYRNGEILASITTSSTFTKSSKYLSLSKYSSGSLWKGTMQGLSILSQIPSEEARKRYQQGNIPPNELGLIGYWKLN